MGVEDPIWTDAALLTAVVGGLVSVAWFLSTFVRSFLRTRGNWFEDAGQEHDAFGTYWDDPVMPGERIALAIIVALVVMMAVVVYVG